MMQARTATALMVLVGGAALGQACVDTTPLAFTSEVDALDGAASDALVDSAGLRTDANLVEACRQCLMGVGCKAQFDACAANAKCAVMSRCLIDAYCLNYSFTDLAHLPSCVFQCAAQAGILGQDDPAITFYAPLAACAQTMCAASCDVKGDR
jgi:hypothetical protein